MYSITRRGAVASDAPRASLLYFRQMQIDIQQLPIPDWGLACPRCGYALRGLPEHRCPECGVALQMAALVQPWTCLRPPRVDGSERPLLDFGLACRECRAPLAGGAGAQCAFCRLPFDIQSYVPPSRWCLLDKLQVQPLDLATTEMLFASEQLPYVPLNARGLPEIVLGNAPLGSNLLVPRAYYLEARFVVTRAARELWQARHTPRPDWRCPQCGESCPGNFELCWNCGAQPRHG